VTQLFYDVDAFLEWVREIRARGITVPVIPGIMPLQTYASFLRMTKLCGTSVPPSILADLDKIKVGSLGGSDVVITSFWRSMTIDL